MRWRSWFWLMLFAAALAEISGCDRRAAASVPTDRALDGHSVIAMARGEIDVPGGLMQVVSGAQGRLTAVMVSEGQHVSAGEILARLDDNSTSLALAGAKASLEGARAQERLMEARRRFAESQLKRVRQASNERATSEQALDEAREAFASSEAELASSRSARETAQTAVRSAELAVDMRAIRAPLAGRIVALSEVGRGIGFVQEGTLVFMLLPDGPLIVRARIEEDFASRIHEGMRAEVFTDSEPKRRYSAQVTRLGGILRRQDLDAAPGERQDVRTMDCELSLDAAQALVGQRVLIQFLDPDRDAAAGVRR